MFSGVLMAWWNNVMFQRGSGQGRGNITLQMLHLQKVGHENCVCAFLYVCVCVWEKLSFVLNENNLSIFYACVKEWELKEVIKKEARVYVYVYVCVWYCFALFRLSILCVSGWDTREIALFWGKQQKHLLVLETTNYNHVYLQLEWIWGTWKK